MSDLNPQDYLAAALPDHPKVGQEPTMTNPCNGVGCGCHAMTEAEAETDRGQR